MRCDFTTHDDLQDDLNHACEERDELVAMLVALQKALRIEGQGSDTPAIQCVLLNVQALASAVEDLNVQCKFWRQAAEHAVKGWNELEDIVEGARERLDKIETNAYEARTLLGSSDEWAPPDITAQVGALLAPQQPFEPGTCAFRVVEEETPIQSPLPWCRNRTACIAPVCTCLSDLKKD